MLSFWNFLPQPSGQIELEITEIFPGQSGSDLTEDWFEIRNTGSTPWLPGVDPDLFYDDESADPSDAVPIIGISSLEPGEYAIVLITDAPLDLTVFSLTWNDVSPLSNVKIGYTDGSGLGGGGDAVTLWLGDPMTSSPIASAAYPSTGNNDGQSYDLELGAFSEVGNANGAVQTRLTAGSDGQTPNIGSPGNEGPISTNPAVPSLSVNQNASLPLVRFVSERNVIAAAEIGDNTDPLAVDGLPLILRDGDSNLSDVEITIQSNNLNVVPNGNVELTGTDSIYELRITPASVGYATITITVEDLEGNVGTFRVYLAASDAVDRETARFHAGSSDGSTAIAIDENRMWMGDDENQTLRLYDRKQSGSAIREINFDAALGDDEEIDIEGSVSWGDTLIWMGSHTNDDRSVLFSTLMVADSLEYLSKYESLRDELIEWDEVGAHGFGENYLNLSTGFEIEALSRNPQGAGAILGLRAPLVNGQAVLVPVSNFLELATNTADSAVIEPPLLIDLRGGSFRSLLCNDSGCLIISGPAGTTLEFRMWTWNGDPVSKPKLRSTNLSEIENTNSIEGAALITSTIDFSNPNPTDSVQLIMDAGTFDYYGDGNEAKDLPLANWKKSRSEGVALGSVVVPPIAEPGEVVITEIMQNPSAVADSVGEWLEVYNNSSRQFDLRDWILNDASGETHIIEGDSAILLNPGAYVTLGNQRDSLRNGGVSHLYSYPGQSFSFDDTEDQILLLSPDSVVIDSLVWGDTLNFPRAEGSSVALEAPQLDNANGDNWCVSSESFGLGDLGTPGMENDCVNTTRPDLRITEIWPGQQGTDVTEDWFEITNFGAKSWNGMQDEPLFYDDESQDPTDAVQISGISEIDAGQSLIVVVGDSSDAQEFRTVWGEVYDIGDVEIGWADGSGLGQGGDAATLFLGTPSPMNIIDFASYPAAPSGLSYDLILESFSAEGTGRVELGTNIAVATQIRGGSSGDEPAIASPGNIGPLNPVAFELKITEMHPGQAGSDLTEDWFEIKNTGNAPWIATENPMLFYDDDSQDPADATPIERISEIAPGEVVIVIIDNDTASIDGFINIWGPVIDLSGVQIGLTDGSGLGSGGDGVALWAGDPTMNNPVDTAFYPDTDGFDGKSWDVEIGEFSEVGNANGAVATIALGGSDGDVPNIGSPGNGLAIPPANDLRITEIFPGQSGSDLTEDWFEITNGGTEDWVSGEDLPLFYDDESADPADAVPVQNIDRIAAGSSVIVLLSNDTSDIKEFRNVWSEVIDLSDVKIGYADGSGLGGGGDAVTLWLGDPNASSPTDTASYPDTDNFDGQSWDVRLQGFSEVGMPPNAVATIALGGSDGDVPNIGSPGDGLVIPPASDLRITEMFPGQSGSDLTKDWFEITNEGTEDWVSGEDLPLFYDDESQDPADAVLIENIDRIAAGASVIVLLANDTSKITEFRDVWSEVIDLSSVEIGYADGSGLGGGGDGVTLWLGDPAGTAPIDTASYPATDDFDGQTWDVRLQAFSEVGMPSNAVATLALGGDSGDVPNIGSPGDGLAVPQFDGLVITELFPGQSGPDLTEDWIEITNTGGEPWIRGMSPTLYYDDDSQDPADAVEIQNIDRIEPGTSAIVVLTGDTADVNEFLRVWEPVAVLDDVPVGWADGSGLGGGGDGATLWIGNPESTNVADFASYPDTEGADGRSWDAELGEFSVVGNANEAVATEKLGGDNGDVPNIGSPGNKGGTTSIAEPKSGKTGQVYPNPVTDVVYYKSPSDKKVVRITIFDQQGKIVYQQDDSIQPIHRVGIGHLAAGLYILSTEDSVGYRDKFKVIKQ